MLYPPFAHCPCTYITRCSVDKTLSDLASIYDYILWVLYFIEIQLMHMLFSSAHKLVLCIWMRRRTRI